MLFSIKFLLKDYRNCNLNYKFYEMDLVYNEREKIII